MNSPVHKVTMDLIQSRRCVTGQCFYPEALFALVEQNQATAGSGAVVPCMVPTCAMPQCLPRLSKPVEGQHHFAYHDPLSKAERGLG